MQIIKQIKKPWLFATLLTILYLSLSHLLFINNVLNALSENRFEKLIELILTFPSIVAFGLGFHEGVNTLSTYLMLFPFIWVVFFVTIFLFKSREIDRKT